ncbi:Uncharacterized protein HZ326_8638 [Fusarium oxysporum f. sp. albedinis]|nr:Uncharacterized protein HZ326_8638 [Fusarium oxysporum f. sp. albedinis]
MQILLINRGALCKLGPKDMSKCPKHGPRIRFMPILAQSKAVPFKRLYLTQRTVFMDVSRTSNPYSP